MDNMLNNPDWLDQYYDRPNTKYNEFLKMKSYMDNAKTSNELTSLREQNKELMRLLGIILEDSKNLKKYPALLEAYNEYLFTRKLILGDDTLTE